MNKIENIKNTEKTTLKTVEIPGFGNLDIIPSINAHACSEPGVYKDLTADEIKNTPIFIRRRPLKEGAVKSLGASLGFVFALLAADPEIAVKLENDKEKWKKITAEQAVDLVNEWETSNKRIFTYRQDCILLNKARKNPEIFGLTRKKLNGMMRHIGNKLSNEEMIAEVPLFNGRDNKVDENVGVVVVLTDEKNPKTVSATNSNRNDLFIYDATMHMNSLESLAEFAQERGIRVNSNELKAKTKMQTDLTLLTQAGGKPVFIVNLRGEKPLVSNIGSIPSTSQIAQAANLI